MSVPREEEIQEFTDTVDEVSRLISGLKDGRLSIDYADMKIRESKETKEKQEKKRKETETAEMSPQRREELMGKVRELQENRARKEAARKRYEEYVEVHGAQHTTDYVKWDMWCPSDEEDAMFDSCRPDTPEFRAIEKDIDDRHTR